MRRKDGKDSKLTPAGELLLLNPDGTVTVYSELDETAVAAATAKPGADAKPKADQAGAAGPSTRGPINTVAAPMPSPAAVPEDLGRIVLRGLESGDRQECLPSPWGLKKKLSVAGVCPRRVR